MNTPSSRVLLIDDHPFYRTGLGTALLGMRMGIVVHEAGTVLQGLDALASQHGFDLIIYDWRLDNKGGGGRKGLIAIAQSAPGVPVLVLSGVEDEDARLAAQTSGAVDYVLKTTEPRALCDLIKSWLQRERAPPLPPHGAKPHTATAPALTARQHQVLLGLAQGSANKMIAESLRIRETTVRGHVSDILRLLNARNRTRAVVLAARWGLI